MPSILHATHIALPNNNSPQNVTITSTTAGSVLCVLVTSINGGVTPSSSGASYVSKFSATLWSPTQLYSAFNVSAGITNVQMSYGAAQGMTGWIFEVGSAGTVSDPFDGVSAGVTNAFNATNLGCGTVTPTNDGLGIAAFLDVLGAVTTYTQGAGWTAGTTTAGDFYETRNTTGGVQIGGASNQATANASNNGEVEGLVWTIDSPPAAATSTDVFFAGGDEWQWLGGDWR